MLDKIQDVVVNVPYMEEVPLDVPDERSESGPALDPYRTIGNGAANSSSCPRGGWVRLTHRDGRQLTMKTICKTWRCLACRDKLLGLFKMRVVIGCSTSLPSMCITFTYKTENPNRLGAAEYVAKDWREFWRLWRKEKLPQMHWLRVTEKTKAGMPHHHVVMTQTEPSRRRVRCYGNRFDVRRFKLRARDCDCWSHIISRLWERVTKDSYITHGMPVGGAKGMATYLSKYMMKTFGEDRQGRRWSTSRGWPGNGRVRLRQTVRKNWATVWYIGQRHRMTTFVEGGDADLRERTGPAWALKYMHDAGERSAKAALERLVYGNTSESKAVL